VGVVTVTGTEPAAPGGELAVISVGLTTVTSVAGTPPKLTPAGPTKLVPVTVTGVPPFVAPDVGEMALTVGAFGFRMPGPAVAQRDCPTTPTAGVPTVGVSSM
jgi:hypothetical protein